MAVILRVNRKAPALGRGRLPIALVPILLLLSQPAFAGKKYSDVESCDRRAVAEFNLDGGTGFEEEGDRTLVLKNLTQDNNVSANVMTLDCSGLTVRIMHNGFDILEDKDDEGNGLGTTSTNPEEVGVVFNVTDVIALGDLQASPRYCDLLVPENGSNGPACGAGPVNWRFPNAFYMDQRTPDIVTTSPQHFKVGPVVPLCSTCDSLDGETGFGLLRWTLLDNPLGVGEPYTTAVDVDSDCDDPDFDFKYPGGDCKDSTHNKSPTVASFPIYRTAIGTTYPTYPLSDSILSNFQSMTDPTITDRTAVYGTYTLRKDYLAGGIGNLSTQIVEQNRMQEGAWVYCYAWTVEDTANHVTGLDSSEMDVNDVRCYYPDTKAPEFVKVSYYKDSAFTDPLPQDDAGEYIGTYNPCFFQGDCDPGPARYIYLKVQTDEPLFTTPVLGATMVADDGLDNDGDGQIDEEQGSFNNIDDDGDGYVDEDVTLTGCSTSASVKNDRKDNDCDGYADEEPDLNAGDMDDDDNDGQTNEDQANEFCVAHQAYNKTLSAAIQEANDDPTVDICQGIPTIGVADTIAPVGIDTQDPDPLDWVCTSLGDLTGDSVSETFPTNSADCESLPRGHTIYRYAWNVTAGIYEEDDEATMVFSGTDAVGNATTDQTPLDGGVLRIDNSPPVISASFPTITSYFDHDNDSATVDVQVAKAKDTPYIIRVSTDEPVMATPTVHIYLPDDVVPTYEGMPSADNGQQIVMTKLGCDDDEPCSLFQGEIDIDEDTNNGLAQLTAAVEDRLKNRKWHATTAQATVDPYDDDRATDDVGADGVAGTLDTGEGDGIPTPGEKDLQPAETAGRFFAIDTIPPDVPLMTLPVTPCDGTYARAGGATCSTSQPTTRTPTLSWSGLADGLDNDDDGEEDEEILDGLDNDGDGTIDEDATSSQDLQGTLLGTPMWQIGFWRLEVSTDRNFATDVQKFTVANQKTGGNFIPPSYTFNSGNPLEERTMGEPYFWRLFALDHAQNESPDSSPEGTIGYSSGSFFFAVDVTKPDFEVGYYRDAAFTDPLIVDPATGLPVTADTATDGEKIHLKIRAAEKLKSKPSVQISQNNAVVIASSALTVSADPSGTAGFDYTASFTVDADGAGKIFNNGVADLELTASDLAGNTLAYTNDIATGSQFLIDNTEFSILEITTTPTRSSLDNDADGTTMELCQGIDDPRDGVLIRVSANKRPAEPATVKVMQFGFNDPPLTATDYDDGIDNDCDGSIDDEPDGINGIDDDGDGLTDEDVASGSTTGGNGGSGCLVEMEETDSATVWEGCYDPVPNFDGDATIVVQWKDVAGNADLETKTFEVDTVAPDPPTLVSPANGSATKNKEPKFEWKVVREADLKDYVLEISTDQNFTTLTYTWTITDTGATKYEHGLQGGVKLSDNKYYWRVKSRDIAKNSSAPSSTFNFTVDTTPPGAPKFDAIPNSSVNGLGRTVVTSVNAPLSGTTEANSTVTIWVNDEPVGEVTADASGKFFVGIDEDEDGDIDEEDNPPTCTQGADGLDDDQDDNVDEDLCGVFLQEGENRVEAQAKDPAGNTGALGCDADTPFYDDDEGTCIVRRDSGAPTFAITYFTDEELTETLPVNPVRNLFAATVPEGGGPIYLLISASEDLVDDDGDPLPPTFSIDQPGTTDVADQTSVSIDGSTRQFLGQYQVHAADGTQYIDGDAQVHVKGEDPEGNITADSTFPTSGRYLSIDTRAPSFQAQYFLNSELTSRALKDDDLIPLAPPGDLYVKITASEYIPGEMFVDVDQQGSTDVTNGLASNVQNSGGTSDRFNFKYKYTVQADTGSTYLDGAAAVRVTASDVAGNLAISELPVSGSQFNIDTAGPAAPTLSLTSTPDACPDAQDSETDAYTRFTQITGTGTAEPGAAVQVYVRDKGVYPPTPGDGKDNDGDGRADEEPNGLDGKDNDMDGFVDEDVTAVSCLSGKMYDSEAEECLTAPSQTRAADGETAALSDGSFNITVSGISPGKNLVYVRAIDKAGNVGDFAPEADSGNQHIVLNCSPVLADSTNNNHTFDAGWNIVGVPLQSTFKSPHQALGLSSRVVCSLENSGSTGRYTCGESNTANLKQAEPGGAYWVYFPETGKAVINSGIISTTRQVALSKGWNLISLPYYSAQPVNWDEDVTVTSSKTVSGAVEVKAGVEYDIASDEAEVLIDPTLYLWNVASESYQSVVPGNGSVQSWVGFLVRALRDNVTLAFPDPVEQ